MNIYAVLSQQSWTFFILFSVIPTYNCNPTPTDPSHSPAAALHGGQMKIVHKANWSWFSKSKSQLRYLFDRREDNKLGILKGWLMVSPMKLASAEFWTRLHKPKSAKSKSEIRYDMKDINGSLAWSLILLLALQIQSCWGHNNVAHLVLWSILGTGHCAHFAAWSKFALPSPKSHLKG